MPPLNYLILLSRTGTVRLSMFWSTETSASRARIVRSIQNTIITRPNKASSVVWDKERGLHAVYRRYASLYFVAGISEGANELLVLETIHLYVELLDSYFGR